MRTLILVILCLCSSRVLGYEASPGYPVKDIPEELLQNSYGIIREEIQVFEIKSISEATFKRKRVVTLLKDKFKEKAKISLFYSPDQTISNIKGIKYDENGNEIDKIKNKDIDDYSAYSDSFFDDNRLKHFDLSNAYYPFTYAYEFTWNYSSLLTYPSWYPQASENMAVQYSKFVIIIPNNMKFRYQQYNFNTDPLIEQIDGKTRYTWEIENMPAIEQEDFMAPLTNYIPYLNTAPNEYSYGGFPGNMSSWETFGTWIWELNKGRDALLPEQIAEVQKVIEGISEPMEKARTLYKYLQENKRYISVQLGIGGFQPFEASFVAEKGYGDCKALTNYMKTLLNIAGIESHYTLVNSGKYARNINIDFPSSQFDHVILCVPMNEDTTWLECTSQDNPFGYLGTFTGDRNVLIVKAGKGYIGRTPAYTIDKNLQIRTATIEVFSQGSAVASIITNYSGTQYENVSGALDASKTDIEKWLYKSIDIPNFNIDKFSYSSKKDCNPEAVEKLELILNKYAVKNGNRVFIQPNLMNKRNKIRHQKEPRKYDIMQWYGFMDIDTIKYKFPDGYHPEFEIEPILIETKFGIYYMEITFAQNEFTYIRKRISYKGIFPPEDYEDYIAFINKIAKYDNRKIVLVNKT